jgi:hypothetical protein
LEPLLGGWVDERSDGQHVFVAGSHRLEEDGIVMGEPVAEATQSLHARGEILSLLGERERMTETMPPKLLVPRTEEARPETKREACDDPAAGDGLAPLKALDGNDDLFDAVGTKDVEVQQPGVRERRVGVPFAELSVDRVTHENLEVVHRAEARRCELAVPLVQRHGTSSILAGGVHERREP